jgi:acyl-CoA thioesterase YciA
VSSDDTTQEDAAELPRDREPVIRIIPLPKDTNPGGDIFGGWIMSHVDLAGGVIAARRANGRVATIAVNSFSFKKPVLVGDLVSIYGHVIRVGNTSVTVALQVFAERRWLSGTPGGCVKVTEADLTYVAIDENRRPRHISPDPT